MTEWRNRIIATGDEAPDQLLANPKNFRRHPKHQQEALRGVLNEVGWVQDVIVNRTTGRLVDGHLRVELALRDGATTVPVKYVELSDAEESLILATFDPISALATADKEQLDALLREVSTGEAGVQQMLADLAEREGIVGFGGGTDGLTDPDEVPDPPVEPTSRLGDLWVLGEHRVLCGDATSDAAVSRVMGFDKAEMVWTDPPYGVAVGDKNKWLNSIARSNRVEDNLMNDTLSEPQLLAMLRDAFGVAARYCTAGAAWYVAAPATPLQLVFGQALHELGILRQELIWVKQNATFAPMGVSYHWKHEPIFYGWLPDGAHRYHGDRKQTTVWEIDRPQASPDHPTMKPVALVERAIEHSSLPGQVVLDSFLGSGTTLLACERLGRKCRGTELDPKYVDVIVKRWEEFTGRTAELHRSAEAAD